MQDILNNILILTPDIYDRTSLMAVSREWYVWTLPHRARNMSILGGNTLELPLMKHINPYSRHIQIGALIRKEIAMKNTIEIDIVCKDDKELIAIYLAMLYATYPFTKDGGNSSHPFAENVGVATHPFTNNDSNSANSSDDINSFAKNINAQLPVQIGFFGFQLPSLPVVKRGTVKSNITAKKTSPPIIMVNCKDMPKYINLLKQCGIYVKGSLDSKVFVYNDKVQLEFMNKEAINKSKRTQVLLLTAGTLAKLGSNYVDMGIVINLYENKHYELKSNQLRINISEKRNMDRDAFLTYSQGYTPEIDEVLIPQKHTNAELSEFIQSLGQSWTSPLKTLGQSWTSPLKTQGKSAEIFILTNNYVSFSNFSANIKSNSHISSIIYPDIIICINNKFQVHDIRLIKSITPNKIIIAYMIYLDDKIFLQKHVFGSQYYVGNPEKMSIIYTALRVLYINIYNLTQSDAKFLYNAILYSRAHKYDDACSITREQYDAILQLL